jgi:hypothetical protein
LTTALIADLLKILTDEANSTVEAIKQNTPKATGKTARSLRFEVKIEGSKYIMKIAAKPFFLVVETGRKPTPSYKPSRTFVDSIKEWMGAKGKTGSAYAIALAIHRKGTKLWQQGGRTDVVSNVINESLTERIASESLQEFAREYLATVVQTFKDGNSNISAARA